MVQNYCEMNDSNCCEMNDSNYCEMNDSNCCEMNDKMLLNVIQNLTESLIDSILCL